MELGELTGEDNIHVSDPAPELAKSSVKPMRGFIEDDDWCNATDSLKSIEPGPPVATLAWGKAQKDVAFTGCKPRRGKRGYGGACPRDRFDPNPRFPGKPHELDAWVRDSGSARIRHKRETLAPLEPLDELRRLALVAVLVETGGSSSQSESLKQMAGVTGVLGRNQRNLAKDPQGAG